MEEYKRKSCKLCFRSQVLEYLPTSRYGSPFFATSNTNLTEMNVIIKCLELPRRIREVPGSNLGLKTGHPD